MIALAETAGAGQVQEKRWVEAVEDAEREELARWCMARRHNFKPGDQHRERYERIAAALRQPATAPGVDGQPDAGSDGRTHHAECWRDHLDCARREVERLRAEAAWLRAAGDEMATALRNWQAVREQP